VTGAGRSGRSWLVAVDGGLAVAGVAEDAVVAAGIPVGRVRFARRKERKATRAVSRTESAPSILGAVGSFAVVRSVKVDPDGGEVLVDSGPARQTVVRARTESGSFASGERVHIFARDDDGVFLICEVDDIFR
jgi:hypothetical protein